MIYDGSHDGRSIQKDRRISPISMVHHDLLGIFSPNCSCLNGGIVVFITAEPDWKCVDGYMNNTVCRFNKSVTLTSDDYKARCKMPREAWTFVDDFTSTVTEVRVSI